MNHTDPNPTPRNRRMHPLVATAAAAVIVASLAATAAITGVFPKASSTGAQNDQTQAAAIATAQPGPQGNLPAESSQAPGAPQSVPQQAAAPAAAAPAAAAPPQYAQTQPPQPAPPESGYAQPPQAAQPAPCAAACGTVEAVSAVRHEGHGTGIGAVGGAVAGGVIGNQFGSGGGRTAMTLLGALGGGVGGNAVEKHIRSTTSYSVRVRMENGRTRYFTYRDAPQFQRGERVHVENGRLVAG